MAEKDSPGPSLELPSLFDRKKKRRSEVTDEPAPTEGSTPPAPPAEPAAASPTPAPAPATEPVTPAEPAARTAPEPSPAEPTRPVEPTPAARTTPPSPAAEPAPTSRPAQPAQRTEPVQPVEPAQPARPGTADDTRAMPAASAGATGVRATDTRPGPAPAAATSHPDPQVGPGPDGTDASEESTGRRMPDLPDLGVAVAALVVGAVVGLLGVVLTFLGLKGCELVTGTDSCGGPGLLVLVAILVAMVLGGAAMLRLFGVPDAGSVSFLGVGMLTVVILVLLLDVLLSVVMIVVIPVLTAGCFALARWVTTQLGEDVMADR
ncbi:hypothetical protein G7072_16065 [Nocardioides sp. HDW12B]|uniref:hypothetical protein n=1 Tax=Nocardioides sp. HDW12B TaxID=2714939 RepID=UPI00140821D3|nr:hypothetical protein [Nocardioides sp. HDW12B]QIK67662.1 hypothetical protein G7072_16065 [Nocardioides sp. HDW12B]